MNVEVKVMLFIIFLVFLFIYLRDYKHIVFYAYYNLIAEKKCSKCKHNILAEYPKSGQFLCSEELFIKVTDIPNCLSFKKEEESKDNYTVDKDIDLDLGIK